MTKQPWRLIFAPEHLSVALSGEIFSTIRISLPGSNHFRQGQLIEGHYLDGLMLLLQVQKDTVLKQFNRITPREFSHWARFTHPDGISMDESLRVMRDHYADLTLESLVSLNYLGLPMINGRAIAGPLPAGLL